MKTANTVCDLCLSELALMKNGNGEPEFTDGAAIEIATGGLTDNNFGFWRNDAPEARLHFCNRCIRGLRTALTRPVEEPAGETL